MRLKELYQDKVCLLSYHRVDCLAGELMQLQSPKGLCVAQCGPAAVMQHSVGTDWLSCMPLVHLCSVVSVAKLLLFSFLFFHESALLSTVSYYWLLIPLFHFPQNCQYAEADGVPFTSEDSVVVSPSPSLEQCSECTCLWNLCICLPSSLTLYLPTYLACLPFVYK